MGESIKGSLLVSQPGLIDPNFRCTVVLVTEHDENGAFGLVLNRAGEHKVADLWRSLTSEASTSKSLAFVGGPVQQSAVFLLHTYDDLADGETPVIPGIYMGSSIGLLKELLDREDEARCVESVDEIPDVFPAEQTKAEAAGAEGGAAKKLADHFRAACSMDMRDGGRGSSTGSSKTAGGSCRPRVASSSSARRPTCCGSARWRARAASTGSSR